MISNNRNQSNLSKETKENINSSSISNPFVCNNCMLQFNSFKTLESHERLCWNFSQNKVNPVLVEDSNIRTHDHNKSIKTYS